MIRVTADGKPACLLLHGFTGGPFEVEPLAEYLQGKGWQCRIPVLPGHEGGDPTALREVDHRQWVAASAKEAEELCRRHGSIDLVGFSMGGLLSVLLSVKLPIHRLVLLGTPYIYLSPSRFLKEFASHYKERDLSEFRTVRRTPLRAAWQFTRLVREAKRELPRIQVPTLIVQGERDHVIHPVSAKLLAQRMTFQPDMLWLPHSRHRLCLEEEAPQLFAAVERFLTQPEAASQHRVP